jgi:hypothetical protein
MKHLWMLVSIDCPMTWVSLNCRSSIAVQRAESSRYAETWSCSCSIVVGSEVKA